MHTYFLGCIMLLMSEDANFLFLNWEQEQWYRVQLNFTGLWMGEIMFHLMTALMPKET